MSVTSDATKINLGLLFLSALNSNAQLADLPKESTCSVGDLGSIPGLGRSPEEGMATHSSILAWRVPWTEEPGGLQSWGPKESDVTE